MCPPPLPLQVLGDIITGVNGSKVKSSSDLYRILDKCQVYEPVARACLPVRVEARLV